MALAVDRADLDRHPFTDPRATPLAGHPHDSMFWVRTSAQDGSHFAPGEQFLDVLCALYDMIRHIE
jgi:hypothetical protein